MSSIRQAIMSEQPPSQNQIDYWEERREVERLIGPQRTAELEKALEEQERQQFYNATGLPTRTAALRTIREELEQEITDKRENALGVGAWEEREEERLIDESHEVGIN